MHPPETVDVSCYTYRVSINLVEMLERCREQGEDLLGFCDTKQLKIHVDPAQADGMARETLLHEILHAVADATGLADGWGDDEESTIRRLSPALLQVLRDNPGLVEFLTDQ